MILVADATLQGRWSQPVENLDHTKDAPDALKPDLQHENAGEDRESYRDGQN
jgi:hypothetical protein